MSRDLNSGRLNQRHHFASLAHDSWSGNSYEHTLVRMSRQRLALDGRMATAHLRIHWKLCLCWNCRALLGTDTMLLDSRSQPGSRAGKRGWQPVILLNVVCHREIQEADCPRGLLTGSISKKRVFSAVEEQEILISENYFFPCGWVFLKQLLLFAVGYDWKCDVNISILSSSLHHVDASNWTHWAWWRPLLTSWAVWLPNHEDL